MLLILEQEEHVLQQHWVLPIKKTKQTGFFRIIIYISQDPTLWLTQMLQTFLLVTGKKMAHFMSEWWKNEMDNAGSWFDFWHVKEPIKTHYLPQANGVWEPFGWVITFDSDSMLHTFSPLIANTLHRRFWHLRVFSLKQPRTSRLKG